MDDVVVPMLLTLALTGCEALRCEVGWAAEGCVAAWMTPWCVVRRTA
jgi:hypothetical protein